MAPSKDLAIAAATLAAQWLEITYRMGAHEGEARAIESAYRDALAIVERVHADPDRIEVDY